MVHELFAMNLKKYRKSAGYTQVKFAQLCGVSVSLIAHVETHGCHASMDLLEKACIVLELEPAKLFEKTEAVSAWDSLPADEIVASVKYRS